MRQSARDRHEGHLLLFFKRKSRLKKGRKREPNARKTTRHLGRTTAGGGRKAGANARSLYRFGMCFAGSSPCNFQMEITIGRSFVSTRLWTFSEESSHGCRAVTPSELG